MNGNNVKAKELLEEIKAAQQIGIKVSVNGVCYSSCQEAELSMVLESGEYMCDYIGDDCGRIIQMNYDKI